MSLAISASPIDKAAAVLSHSVPNLIGEKLEYSISLNNISLGRQILTFESVIEHEQREAYVVTFQGQPNLVVRALNYKNNEKYYIDKETFLPFYTYREYSGGFDSGSMESFYRKDKEQIDIVVIEKNVEQRLSLPINEPFQGETTLILFSRFVDLSKRPMVEVFSSAGLNYIQLSSGAREKITVPAGNFESEVAILSPDIGKVWLSQDIFRIPLKIILNTNAGKLEMKLLSISR